MYLRENLVYLRKKRSLSQEEVGQMLGVSSQVVSNWERGYTNGMAVETIISLAKLFSVSIDDLLTKDLRPMGSVLSMNLRYLRKRNKYTQEDMTKLLGYKDKSSYCLIENGITQISVNNLVNVAEFFGFTVDDLLKKDLSKEG